MRTDLLVLGAGALVLLLGSGCVSHSTSSDYSAVRTIVRERARLDLEARRAAEWQEADPDVGRLVAQPLTVESAVRIALLNNRNLRAELLGLGVARGQLVQASLFPNPDFEAEVRFPQGPVQDAQWDFGVGVNLTDIILRGQRQGVAAADLDAARFQAAGATLDLGFHVRLAFFDVQAAQQHVELMRTALNAFAASYETAQALHHAGNITDLDLSTEQAAYEGARVAVAEAEADLIDRRERLNVLLGFFGQQTTWQIAARLPDPAPNLGDLNRLESRAIEASIELAESRASLTAAARRVGLTETAGWMPDISLGVHAEHDGQFWEVGPALTGRLPLFDRQQGNVISRQAEFDSLRERYVADAVGVRASVRAARARALSAQERARQYRETVLPLRERVVNQTVLQYNAMQVGVFQLLQARRDQLEAGRMYVEALLEYWQARATLEQLLAGRLAGTVATLTEARPRDVTSRSGERGH